MMREFGVIHARYWQWAMEAALSASATMLGAYLMTCEHSNLLGCFRVPVQYIAADLPGFASLDAVRSALAELEQREFIQYDARGWVWLQRYLEWNELANPNMVASAFRLAEQIPDPVPFAKAVMATVCAADRFKEKRVPAHVKAAVDQPEQMRLVPPSAPAVKPDAPALEGVAAPAVNPSATVSKQGPGELYISNEISPLTPLAGGDVPPAVPKGYAGVALRKRKRRNRDRSAGEGGFVPQTPEAKLRHAAVGQVLAVLHVTGTQAVRLAPVVWAAMERHERATGQTAAQCAQVLEANHRAWRDAGKPCFAWEKWIGQGHCWHAPVVSRGDQAEQRRQADAAVGVWRPELETRKSLEDVNREMRTWGMPEVSPEMYAEGREYEAFGL